MIGSVARMPATSFPHHDRRGKHTEHFLAVNADNDTLFNSNAVSRLYGEFAGILVDNAFDGLDHGFLWILHQQEEGWCRRRDSNPHSLATTRP